jgi:hypothetical protein
MRHHNINKVSIKFKPGAYGIYRSLNNKPWYALAEYVDNAIQSYIDNKEKLIKLHSDYQLKISIEINKEDDFIRIIDNAGGINYENFLRAFEPANIPADNTGLSEYGMGMKIASIWFCDRYEVRSSFLDENVERTVRFDLERVMNEEKEELEVFNNSCNENKHFTEITLSKLSNNAPSVKGLQFNKVKDHLTSIYRKFLRSGELVLTFNGDPLIYIEPKILYEKWYDDEKGDKILWKKEVNFKYDNYSLKGHIGLLNEMSGINSGLSLFRRGRVITGSHDEKFHPKILCGQPGSPRDKRLFGELELSGFNVSFEKGSFVEIEELNSLLELIKIEFQDDKYSILKQGDYFRKVKSSQDKRQLAEKVVKNIKQKHDSIEYKDKLSKTINTISLNTPIAIAPESMGFEKGSNEVIDKFEEQIFFNGIEYKINFEILHDKTYEHLYTLTIKNIGDNIVETYSKINLEHDFFANHTVFENKESIEPIIAIIKGLIISELFSQSQGTTFGGNIRLNLNKLLKKL